jgi:predicted unusual protein kinase regulating ubiquinone biosynthesis (AarF/ABC1/UbiB family)
VSEDQGSKISTGRLSRLAKMATLTARTAGDLALGRAKKALGDDSLSQEKAAAKKVLETLGTMKGAAMKLGQQLAMEADTLPPEAREIVSKLFAQAPAMGYEEIARVIQDELGDAPDVVFAEFDQKPLASASLGQVHRARLKDGTQVAVKVQYPGVAEALVNDLKNAGLLVRTFNGASRQLTNVDPTPYYEEIRREIGAEVDYLREAKLSTEFAQAVSHVPELHVPKVYPVYSTARVLTMELVEGKPLHTWTQSPDLTEEERFRVGRQLAFAVLVPFVKHRMVHGDPHPGNFLVRPDGRLTVLDFGAVKKLTPEFVSGFWGLMEAELENREPDFVPLLQRARFNFKGDLDKARDTLRSLHGIASRPVRQETYDWAKCEMVVDFRKYFLQNLKDVAEIEAPPESILFYRAIGGLANNLKMLKTNGPYREVCREIGEMLTPHAT